MTPLTPLTAEDISRAGFAEGGTADQMYPGPTLATLVHAATANGKILATLSDDDLIGVLRGARFACSGSYSSGSSLSRSPLGRWRGATTWKSRRSRAATSLRAPGVIAVSLIEGRDKRSRVATPGRPYPATSAPTARAGKSRSSPYASRHRDCGLPSRGGAGVPPPRRTARPCRGSRHRCGPARSPCCGACPAVRRLLLTETVEGHPRHSQLIAHVNTRLPQRPPRAASLRFTAVRSNGSGFAGPGSAWPSSSGSPEYQGSSSGYSAGESPLNIVHTG